MRPGHAAILDSALADTRRTLEELGRVADVGAEGATALGEQDRESDQKYEGWDGPELQRKDAGHGETRVI